MKKIKNKYLLLLYLAVIIFQKKNLYFLAKIPVNEIPAVYALCTVVSARLYQEAYVCRKKDWLLDCCY